MHALACLHVSAHCASVFLSLNNVKQISKLHMRMHAAVLKVCMHAHALLKHCCVHSQFGVLIPLSTFLVPSCIQSDCVLSSSKSDDDTVSYIWPFRSSPNSPRLRL